MYTEKGTFNLRNTWKSVSGRARETEKKFQVYEMKYNSIQKDTDK